MKSDLNYVAIHLFSWGGTIVHHFVIGYLTYPHTILVHFRLHYGNILGS